MEQFTQQLKELLQELLGEKYEVQKHEVTKINDCKLTALSVTEKGARLGVTVYLDDYYKHYEKGKLENIAYHILNAIQTSDRTDINEHTLDEMLNFEEAKGKIYFRLLNKDLNKDYLEDKCYIEYLDMAIVFYLMLESDDIQIASTSVQPAMLGLWSVTENELLAIAKENMKAIMPSRLVSLEKMYLEMIGIEYDDEFSRMMSPPILKHAFYVLTNQKGLNGAGAILYDDELKNFALDKGVETVLILPSSIHETLLVPVYDEEDIDIEFFRGMVTDTNQTSVRRGNLLSNNVYVYDLKEDKITIWK